jgi:hypothetical protein
MTGRGRFPREREIRFKSRAPVDYVEDMDARRDMFGAAMMVGSVWSALAAALVVALDSLGAAPRPALILGVILIGFVASWVQTGRVARTSGSDHGRHLGRFGVAVVRARQPIV